MNRVVISLDAMGGDYGPSVIVASALISLKQHQKLDLILVGNKDVLTAELTKNNASENERLRIHHAAEVVAMNEPPAQALRFKKDSSLRVSINLVKNKTAHACVSAGNTGALMATAKFVLKTIPGIDRPAISALLPTMINQKNVRVLDLGANVDTTAEQLFQFAVMGSILVSSVGNIKRPAVGLLNIGEEDIKGNEQVKQTAKLLEQCNFINYIGFIEGDDIYKGIADVVVCDGFVGNVALKTSEGLAKLITQYIREAFNHNWLSKLVAISAWPVLRRLKERLDPAHYNGASFVGLQGTVVKSHGSANVEAFSHAIEEALLEVEKDVPKLIFAEVEALLSNR